MKQKNISMKTKYERLSKVEKKELLDKYKVEKKEFYNKMMRMFYLIYFGIIYGVVMFIYDMFFKHNTLSYVLDIVVVLFCIIALIKVYSIRKDLLNRYLLKKDSKN